MFSFILIAFLVLGIQQSAHGHRIKNRIIKSAEIVNYINNLDDSSWKADRYRTDEIDVDTFVRTKLGVKMPRRRITPISGSKKHPSEVGITNTASLKSRGLKREHGSEIPKNFTWTDQKNTDCPINKIRDQSNCASSWAVAAASVFSDRLCIASKGKIRTPISSNHVIACNNKRGCQGGYYMSEVYNFFKNNGTITGGEYDSDEGCQPYSIRPCDSSYHIRVPCVSKVSRPPRCKNTKCSNDWYEYAHEPKMYKITGYHSVGSEMDEYSIKKEIYDNGPITAVFYVFADFLFYKSGVYDYKRGLIVGEHAARVVGWGEENGVKYWLAANSWSTSWGENGFFKVKRGLSVVDFQNYMDAITPLMD